MEEGGDVGFHDVLRFGLHAAVEEPGLARGGRFGSDEGVGRHRHLGVELPDTGGLGGEVRVVFPPMREEAGGLFGGAFFLRGFEGFADEGRQGVEGVRCGGGDGEADAAEVVGLVVVGVEAAVALDEVVAEMGGAAGLVRLGEFENKDGGIVVAGGVALVRPGRVFVAIQCEGGGAGGAVVGFAFRVRGETHGV